MKFTDRIKKTISIFLSFIFILNSTPIHAAVSINVEQRAENMGEFLRDSDRPSNMPVAAYNDFFEKENINLVENVDVSQYLGMKAFIGYGVYDLNENQCQYLEVPGKGKYEFDMEFEEYARYNGHSYGITRNSMTYTECMTVASEFGGSPVSIDNSSENMLLNSVFANDLYGEIWVGATMSDCSEPYYTSGIGRTQFYTMWDTEVIENTCNTSQRSVRMLKNGRWEKVNGGNLNRCVVEWTTLEYYRPIRVCAPWWKIMREFKSPRMGLYNEDELNRINQADIPATLNICTKYDTSIKNAFDINGIPVFDSEGMLVYEVGGERITNVSGIDLYDANGDPILTLDQRPRRDITCTSYYDRTIAPECARNMFQDQCYVDECQGYLKNACRHKDQNIVGKGYVKGQIISGGEIISVKIKDEVTTHTYSCPPSPPSNRLCEASSKVVIWPQECPGSNCLALKDCLYSAQDANTTEACYNNFTCEKIYSSRDIPPELDSNGVVVKLFGLCENGDQLEFFPNIISKNNSVCEEYEEFQVTESVTQKCIVEKPVQNHQVNVAFTAEDIYENDDSCLRTDIVKDSQKLEAITMNITHNGYFKHKITKVYLDESTDLIYDGGSDALLLSNVLGEPAPTGVNKIQTQTCNINIDCTGFEDPINADFYSRTQSILLDNLVKNTDIGYLDLINHKITILDLNDTQCANYPADHGFASYSGATSSVQNMATGQYTCTIEFDSTATDSQLDYVSTLDGTQLVFNFTGDLTKEDCLKKAVCIGGKYNDSSFGADYSSTGTCRVVSGSTPDSYMDYLKTKAGCVDSVPVNVDPCAIPTSSRSAYTEINGFESILFFEDYLSGPWGYHTNFNTKLPKLNKVSITTIDYSNQESYPLIDIATVTDHQRYLSDIFHTNYLSKTPGYLDDMGMTNGYVLLGASILTGFILPVVSIILTKPREMNSQNISWVIDKDVVPLPGSLDSNPNNGELPLGIYDLRKLYTVNHTLITRTIVPNGTRRLYISAKYNVPRAEKNDFIKYIGAFKKVKEEMLKCAGWTSSQVAKTFHPSESSVISGYPGCPWYKPWCEKEQSYNWYHNVDLTKNVNTIYYGAVQSMTVLLPYKGDFLFEALDKYDNILGTVRIQENSFINAFTTNGLKFAQVKFGRDMQLGNGVTESRACLSDPMVEWGGGVSGAYYEEQTTGISNNCVKSNDTYVEDHAMVKIRITPLNMVNEGISFIYRLTKPMPFANRVYAVTLDKLQTRNYRCYGEFPECLDSQFQEEE